MNSEKKLFYFQMLKKIFLFYQQSKINWKNTFSLKEREIIFILICTFIFLNLLVRGVADVNQNSRLMAMKAIAIDHTLYVDNYVKWSHDWAQTPDGHYYSNKAPFAILIGTPLYFIIDKITKNLTILTGKKWIEVNPPSPHYGILLSLFFQIIPFALLGFFYSLLLKNTFNIPFNGIIFFLLALFFGNTSSHFVNVYFGHGLSALLLLTLVYFIIQSQWKLVGLFFGFSILNDYGAALILPFLLIIMTTTLDQNQESIKLKLSHFLLGGVLPCILWIWYHKLSFGGILNIPNKFQNPVMRDMVSVHNNLWGIFSPLPNGDHLFELLFGTRKGMLYCVPWIILAIIYFFPQFLKSIPNFIKRKKEKDPFILLNSSLIFFTLSSTAALLWMNSSFGSWHGGSTPGPRYISLVFPLYALIIALNYRQLPKNICSLFWLLLGVSILFRALVYSTTLLTPHEASMWSWHLHFLREGGTKHLFRFFLFILPLLYLFIKLLLSNKRICYEK